MEVSFQHISLMRSLSITVLVLSLATVLVANDGDRSTHRLFHVERSKGPQVVCYDAVVVNGKLHENEPVDVYWLHPESGNAREELNWVERWKAYGVEVMKSYPGQDSCDVTMRAHRKPMRIVQRGGKWMALTYIDGKVCELIKLYVATDESGVFPKVLYIKLTGKVRWSGEIVTETIVQD